VAGIVQSDAFRMQGAGVTVSVRAADTDPVQVARTETVTPAPLRE